MGKIAPTASKYIIKAQLDASGIIEKPDAVGAIFGQTEGLLGADLELRELQKSGRIGRIEVSMESREGKTRGTIEIPSSTDKAETAIIAAALETIDRIGPCNANIKIISIDDIRVEKRRFIVERAKELLGKLVTGTMPDTQEITDTVRNSVRVAELVDYGPEKIPAGPEVGTADELIVVEGRADVLNLLRNGIKNVVGVEGTHIPSTLIKLSKQKTLTLFLDGDRGGDLILKEMQQVAEIDFVARAPDGKEVEELTQKEILKSLRAKVAVEQADVLESHKQAQAEERYRNVRARRDVGSEPYRKTTPLASVSIPTHRAVAGGPASGVDENIAQIEEWINEPTPVIVTPPAETVQVEPRAKQIDDNHKTVFKKFIDELVGTRAAYLLDEELKVLGKVPVSEIQKVLDGMEGVHAVVMDGMITNKLVSTLGDKKVHYLAGMRKMSISPEPQDMHILVPQDLQ